MTEPHWGSDVAGAYRLFFSPESRQRQPSVAGALDFVLKATIPPVPCGLAVVSIKQLCEPPGAEKTPWVGEMSPQSAWTGHQVTLARSFLLVLALQNTLSTARESFEASGLPRDPQGSCKSLADVPQSPLLGQQCLWFLLGPRASKFCLFYPSFHLTSGLGTAPGCGVAVTWT